MLAPFATPLSSTPRRSVRVSFRCRRSLAVPAVALAISACASLTVPSGDRRSHASLEHAAPAFIQWSGSFQAVQQQNGNANAPRGRNNASGNVVLTASSRNSIRAKITLNSATSSQYVHWALVSGRCGSSAIPLLTVNQFPDISLSNGRGQLDGQVPLDIPTSGTYHVDVYWSNGQDQADVMTCANLRLEPRSS